MTSTSSASFSGEGFASTTPKLTSREVGRTRCEKPLLVMFTLAGADGGPTTAKPREARPAFPHATLAEAEPIRAFAGIVHFHDAFPARATTDGSRCSEASAYRIDALQRTPVGRTTTESEAGWPWKTFCGTKPKRRLVATSIDAPAVAARQSPVRAATANGRACTGTSIENRVKTVPPGRISGRGRAGRAFPVGVTSPVATSTPVSPGRAAPFDQHGDVADGAARPDDPRALDVSRARAAHRNRARLARTVLRRLTLAAAELEAAPRALPRAVSPFHRRAAAKAALHGGSGHDGVLAHLESVEKGPDRPLETQRGNATGAPVGRPGNVVLEDPDQQQNDDDERDETATNVHSGLLLVS